MGKDWTLRSFQPGDETAINRAFCRVFRQHRPLSHWLWKFSACPWGMAVAVAAHDSGEILAHFAAIPTPFQVKDRNVMVGQGVDAFRVDLGAAATSEREIYRKTAKFFFREFCQQGPLELIYGLAGSRHARVLTEHLGWVATGSPQTWVHKLSPGKRFLPRVHLVHGFHPLLWETLWENSRHRYPVAAIRNLPFVTWRYRQHPEKPYLFVFALHKGNVAAGAVLRMQGGVCLGVDLLWDGERDEDLAGLLQGIKRLADHWGAERLELWLRGDPAVEQELQRQGFQSGLREDITVAVISFAAHVDPVAFGHQLYLTHGDGDLL